MLNPQFIPIREALEISSGIDATEPVRQQFGRAIGKLLFDQPRTANRYTLLSHVLAALGAVVFVGVIAAVAAGQKGSIILLGTVSVVALIAPALIRRVQHFEADDLELLGAAAGDQADRIAELIRFRRDLINGRIQAYERRAVDGPSGVWKKIDRNLFAADNGWVFIVGKREDRSLVRSRRTIPQGQIWIDSSTLPSERNRTARQLIESDDEGLLRRVKAATLSHYAGATHRRLKVQFQAIEAFREPEIAALASKQEQIRTVLENKHIGISESGLKQIRYGIYTMLEKRLRWPESA